MIWTFSLTSFQIWRLNENLQMALFNSIEQLQQWEGGRQRFADALIESLVGIIVKGYGDLEEVEV